MPTFHRFKGSNAYELQIGKLVLQVPYRAFVDSRTSTRFRCYNDFLCRNFGLHIDIDPFGRWL